MRTTTRNWASIDWSRPSSEIATAMGCSIANVYIHRRKHAPETIRRQAPSLTPVNPEIIVSRKRMTAAELRKKLSLDPVINSGPETVFLRRVKGESEIEISASAIREAAERLIREIWE